MSKITFRADDDLVQRLEEFEASKSEVMREALRAYLDGVERGDGGPGGSGASGGLDGAETVDDALAQRVDQLIGERLDAHLRTRNRPQDVNVNITLDGMQGVNADSRETGSDADVRKTSADDPEDASYTSERTCNQCGENMSADHVYCPNCGEKASHRVFCECGDELRSDWAFCPSCGRRTPAADVLDRP